MAMSKEFRGDECSELLLYYLLPYLSQRKWFCDLDGVLADFDGGVSKLLGSKYTSKELWKAVTANSKSFWKNLEWLRNGKRLWQAISDKNPSILTGLPYSNKWDAINGKRDWCKKNLNLESDRVITCWSRDKFKHCSPGDILIDDREKAREPWEKAGGIFILYDPNNIENVLKQIAEIH